MCRLEAEIASLEKERREMFLSDSALIRAGLDLSFSAATAFWAYILSTSRNTEVRAWTIKKGTKAPRLPARIHSDF
jgi:ribosome-binding ATPase YchF (GTP1/OBG family)